MFFLIIIAGAEIAAGVLGFIHKGKIEERMTLTLQKKWEKMDSGNSTDTATKEAIIYVEKQVRQGEYGT